MSTLPRQIIFVLFFLSVAYSIVQVSLNSQAEVVSDASDTLWAILYSVLVAVWATKEPKQESFQAPFEFGAFLYFAWPIVLPYYLVKTRGIEGLVLFIGFVGMYAMPFVSGLVAYVYIAE